MTRTIPPIKLKFHQYMGYGDLDTAMRRWLYQHVSYADMDATTRQWFYSDDPHGYLNARLDYEAQRQEAMYSPLIIIVILLVIAVVVVLIITATGVGGISGP